MKENFPNLAKEIEFQEVKEAQRVPNGLDPMKHTPRHIIISLPKIKDKERIIKAARENEIVTCQGVPIRLSTDFSKETLQARRGWKFKGTFIQSHERQGPPSKTALASKAII